MGSPAAISPRRRQFQLEAATIAHIAQPGRAVPVRASRPPAPSHYNPAPVAPTLPTPLPPHEPTHDCPDDLEHRLDVVGFEEKSKYFFLPFWKDLEVTHPKSKTGAEEENVIVLDLDDIATSNGGGHPILPTAALQNLLLGGASFLALYFGTRTAIHELIDETKELGQLATDKGAMLQTARDSGGLVLSSVEYERLQKNLAALLYENKQASIESQSERLFTGVFSGIGATGIGIGAALEMPAIGAAAAAAAGATIIMVAAPFMTVFGAGIAGQCIYDIYRTLPMSRRLDAVTDDASIGNEAAVRGLLERRIKTIRRVYTARAASSLGLAVGAPLSVFGGLYGLALLLPSIAAVIVAGYADGKHVHYNAQLTWEDMLGIDGKHAIINAIDAAHKHYALLKQLKGTKRLLYPYAESSPQPVRGVVKSVAWMRRHVKRDWAYPPAAETFFDYLRGHTEIDLQSVENSRRLVARDRERLTAAHPDPSLWGADEALRDAELRRKDAFVDEQTAMLSRELCLQDAQRERGARVDEAVFCLLRQFIGTELFRALAEAIVDDRKLRHMLMEHDVMSDDGHELHLDANKMVLLFTEDSPLGAEERYFWADELFQSAERVLFTTGKNRAQWRQRQLLDFLAARLVADANSAELTEARAEPAPTPPASEALDDPAPVELDYCAPGIDGPCALDALDVEDG